MERALAVFGTKLPGAAYRLRPGAYALVFDDAGRIALVQEEGEWYLPGGGIEAGETTEQALLREVGEECACGARIGTAFAEALEFVENRAGERFEVHARYFEAEFTGTPGVAWLAPAEACARTRRRSDAWAITAAAAGRAARHGDRATAVDAPPGAHAAGSSTEASSPGADARPRLVDLSHTVYDGLVTYPGLPAPRITDHLDRASSRAHYAPGTEFAIAKIELVANTGTYLDAPFHRYAGARDLAELPLDTLADLPAIVVRSDHGRRAIDAECFEGRAVAGRAVLVHTGWSAHFGTPAYGSGHPFLTRAAAERLVEGGARLVGIDSLNIDDTSGGERPVHSLLLEHDVRIVEHLTNLDALPDEGFRFYAVPPKVRGMGSFPVRAFARLEG